METRTYAIGVEATMDVIGGKWKPIILCNLRHGAMRPSDLKRGITGLVLANEPRGILPNYISYLRQQRGFDHNRLNNIRLLVELGCKLSAR